MIRINSPFGNTPEIPLWTERSVKPILKRYSKPQTEPGESIERSEYSVLSKSNKPIFNTNPQLPTFLSSLISDPRSLTPVKKS